MPKHYFPGLYLDLLKSIENPIVLDHVFSIVDERRKSLDRDIKFEYLKKTEDLHRKTEELTRIIRKCRAASTPEEIQAAKEMVEEAINRMSEE